MLLLGIVPLIVLPVIFSLVVSVFVRIMPFGFTVSPFCSMTITVLSPTVRFEHLLGTGIEFSALKTVFVASAHCQEYTKDQSTCKTENNLSFHIVFPLPRFNQVASKTLVSITPIF